MWRQSFDAAAANFLGVERDEGQQAAVEAAEACAAGHRLAPFAAARAYELARRALAPAAGRAGAGEGELLAVWLADSVLAHKLKWPFVLPLLAGELFSAAGRRAAGDLGDGAETTRILFGYARAAARPATLPPNSAGARKNFTRRRRNCARKGRGPRSARCSMTIF